MTDPAAAPGADAAGATPDLRVLARVMTQTVGLRSAPVAVFLLEPDGRSITFRAKGPSMIGVMPCSGACNVGQMSTKAVVEAIQRRRGGSGFVCALGLPLQIPGIVKKAHDNYTHHIAVNGCDVSCATKALQSVDVEPDVSILVTETTCIEKNGDLTEESGLPALVDSILQAVDRTGLGSRR